MYSKMRTAITEETDDDLACKEQPPYYNNKKKHFILIDAQGVLNAKQNEQRLMLHHLPNTNASILASSHQGIIVDKC
jgi:hypothetical protein